MLHEIQAYKHSCVLMAVSETGILEMIENGVGTIEELAERGGMNPLHLELLLLYLASCSYIENRDQRWYLSQSFQATDYASMKTLKDIISYEAFLFRNWLTPNKLIAALRSSAGHRPFDKEGWTEEGKQLYKKVTYANNLIYISVRLRGYLKEFGIERLCCFGEGSHFLYGELEKSLTGLTQTEEMSNVEGIILFNKIHYISPLQLEEILTSIKNNTYLIIVDFFHDKKDIFLNGLLIDWMTHGGIYFPDINSILSFCVDRNLTVMKSTFLKRIHTSIVVIKYEGE